MLVEIECTYCGFKTERQLYIKSNITCDKCGDKKVKLRDRDREKIDYYQGAPEFPEKPLDIDLSGLEATKVEEEKEPEKSQENQEVEPQDIWSMFGFID